MTHITKRGDYQWQAQIRRVGYETETETFETKVDAERWARSIEKQMDSGTFTSLGALKRTTLGDVLLRYLDEVTPKKRSAKQEAVKIRGLLSHPISRRYLGKRLANPS